MNSTIHHAPLRIRKQARTGVSVVLRNSVAYLFGDTPNGVLRSFESNLPFNSGRTSIVGHRRVNMNGATSTCEKSEVLFPDVLFVNPRQVVQKYLV